MPIAVQIIAVFAVSGLSIFLLYKGWSPIVTPVLMSVLLLIFSGVNPLTGLTDIFLQGFMRIHGAGTKVRRTTPPCPCADVWRHFLRLSRPGRSADRQ